MAGKVDRVVLFGATGLTGRSVLHRLVAAGIRPVLAVDDPARVAAEGLPTLTVARGAAVELYAGDLVVSASGPFLRSGTPLLAAAVAAGATYLDCCAEHPFLQQVYEIYGPLAAETGATLLPGCGYAQVAGVLAGSLALEAVPGAVATAVRVGYFLGGGSLWPTATAGTLASVAGVFGLPTYAYRGDAVTGIEPEVRDFVVNDRVRTAVSVGAGEHHTLPRTYPSLESVDVYVGALGSAVRWLVRVPPPALYRVGGAGLRLMARWARGRARHPALTVRVLAVASDRSGPLAEVHLSGVDPYVFTAGILSWAVRQVVEGELLTKGGAFGPVEAFGLGALEVGCAEAGISRLSG